MDWIPYIIERTHDTEYQRLVFMQYRYSLGKWAFEDPHHNGFRCLHNVHMLCLERSYYVRTKKGLYISSKRAESCTCQL